MLIEEWYVNRHIRQQRLASVVEIVKDKKEKQMEQKKEKPEEVVVEEYSTNISIIPSLLVLIVGSLVLNVPGWVMHLG
ncbi:MAG: hypothetical protein H6773_00965 [Pseudomonadales bacterium]|nr:hypothetical protein [Pseudomonadales bacterium]